MLPSPSSCRRAFFPSYALLSLSKTTTNMRSIVISCFEFEFIPDALFIRVRGSSAFLTESTAVHTEDSAAARFPLLRKLPGSAPHPDRQVAPVRDPQRTCAFFLQFVPSTPVRSPIQSDR